LKFFFFYCNNNNNNIATKGLGSTTIFNVDNIKNFEFLKDHVTLKTKVMAAEYSALQLQELITL